ncbi:MAG: glycine cleavage system aminomethyltransferase GcvT [Chloroflexi bacterium]|nr:glycine cleavage system aminomethyltransferase GcvT [Chloroflexota bacterium]
MNDFLFRGSIADLDPSLNELIDLESERQYRKIILIPSESTAPLAIRQVLSSPFQNIYAEGYPDEETRWFTEEKILDYEERLAYYRRFSDPRYYKGVEYADTVEALARRRCAELFAANGVTADEIYVNVQALSGAPANNAVYHALVNPGDTIMGMNLLHGGHLSHGSSVNRSGKYYKAVHYTIDPKTEQIDYEAVEELAIKTNPKFIIAGYSSYPWAVDWAKFKAIAQKVGAYLFADIAHVAGLVAGGAYPSPVGYADIITFTTHKSLCGPRGACILTTDPVLAKKIDRAVFPGEQGGPHVNVFGAIALTFKLARTPKFAELQHQIVKNCIAFCEQFRENGFRIPYGGTNTHLMNLDCSSIKGIDGTALSGDQAARILDIAGIVVNRNTIPGDLSAADPSGIRLGTPWVTQRGMKEKDMQYLANVMSDILKSTKPYTQIGRKGKLRKSKVNFMVLENAKVKVRSLAENLSIDYEINKHGYPHFYYIDDVPNTEKYAVYELMGENIRSFLNFAVSCDISALMPGDSLPVEIYTPEDKVNGVLTCDSPSQFRLSIEKSQAGLVAAWLRDLSDGFVDFGRDIEMKLPGVIIVKESDKEPIRNIGKEVTESIAASGKEKPYFIGMPERQDVALPDFQWYEQESPLKRTPLYTLHKQLGAKIIPFAGWEMPVWYTSVVEEHQAVRKAAGLFDVAHMGVYQAEGDDACAFLDSVVGNDITSLGVGESCYTHLMDPDANVIDDLLIYRRSKEKYLIVVNASNDDKDWKWLNSVKDGKVCVDRDQPWVKAYGRNVHLRNLRNPSEGADMRVDIALQGPLSREILLSLGVSEMDKKAIMSLQRTQLCEANVGGFDLVISRTGYTGEKMAFELFVHPEKAAALFQKLLQVGEPFGIKPVGLGARDSLRTEAGLPLYGHEMGGEKNLSVGQAGFGSYVKTYKPWFIGRKPFIEKEKSRDGEVVRFRFSEKGVRMAHPQDIVIDKRGKVIGWVTSCAIDSDGFLTGQAYVPKKYSEEGTQIFITQKSDPKTVMFSTNIGDRVLLPNMALVLSRFPK